MTNVGSTYNGILCWEMPNFGVAKRYKHYVWSNHNMCSIVIHCEFERNHDDGRKDEKNISQHTQVQKKSWKV